MATADFVAKQGDTAIVWGDTLTYSDGSSVNLTGASVNFVMRSLSATTPVTNAPANITNPTSPATVSYSPTAADTATAGEYMGNWVVTFSGGKVETFPTDGYLWVEIQQNLTTAGGATLVSLPELKSHLNINATDRSRDSKLLLMLNEVVPVIEQLVGDVLVKQYDEWYDGGNTWIVARHRPIVSLIAVTEFRGPQAWNLKIIQDPAHGDLYSCFYEPNNGTITRRTSGGGITAFPPMPRSVHAIYTAGQSSIPANVKGATKELIRVNFQQTQQGRPAAGGAGLADEELTGDGQVLLGFFVPGRVREMLLPNRKAPRIF
jgi:hypothetical protein